MRLARIKNKYMYDCSAWRTMTKDQRAKNPGLNPEGEHWYAVYTERNRSGKIEYRAVQLNHLYIVDKNRQLKLLRGLYIKEKLPIYPVPSLLKKEYYNKNHVDGGEIDIKNKKYVKSITNNHISADKARRIKDFAKKRIK
jgi:hypothetical protein